MKTIVEANLTTNPVVKTDKRGFKFASFGVAEDTKKKNEDGTFTKTGVKYYSVTAYGDYAMQIAMGMSKGDRVKIVGDANLSIGEKKINFFKMKDGRVKFRKGEKQTAKAA